MSYSPNKQPSRFQSRNSSSSSRSSGFGFGGGRSGGGSRGRGRVTKFLDPKVYTQSAVMVVESTPQEVEDKIQFSSFNLLPIVIESLTKRGYLHPTEIQAKSIPTVLEGKDLVAISQTGSGKTGTFLIPLLNQAKKYQQDNGGTYQTLIVAPTRELAFQIDKELHEFDMKKFGFWSQTCVGGTGIQDQIRNLRKANQFIIGTPGRLVDLAKRGALDLSKIKTVVLDEMDRMLEMGFVEDITWLIEQVPAKHQSLFFSATLNSTIRPILKTTVPEAVYVELQQQKPSDFVEQSVVRLNRNDSKLDALMDILTKPEVTKTLVFVNTKQAAEFVTEHLKKNEQRADYIHGGKTQSSRFKVLNQFKRVKAGTLVATDVAARGLDVHDITHVINFDEPQSYEDYIHRIGRTGRAGKYGTALTLLNR